ncbi:SAM-dependent chlorinase/fluorinase [bacterium]|nr:SAM-dependent chlorinase/fluorinase [bacterium]
MALIALATDFGEGPYVGQMKAVLLSHAPRAQIVDLFHSVSPQAVLEGAFLLSRTWAFFPRGTVFVAVVDPGVGTRRNILAVRAWGRIFLAPDNGLLSFVPPRAVLDVHLVETRSLFLPTVSSTFHGRDIFAPVAAALSRGTNVRRLGRKVRGFLRDGRLFPERSGGRRTGRIVHIDRFGNAVTNLPSTGAVRGLCIGRRRYGNIVRTYAEAPLRRPVVLRGSFGTWEIALRNGSAARAHALRVGMPVREA